MTESDNILNEAFNTSEPIEEISTLKSTMYLIFFLALPLVSGMISGYWGMSSHYKDKSEENWYNNLNRKGWYPPPWVFGPIWTAVYLFMGLASWLIWKLPESEDRTKALKYYFMQLILNLAWTPIFFQMQMILGALIDIFIMDGLVVLLSYMYYSLGSTWAAGLMIPYLVWLTIATYLNIKFYILN